ncbi:MAG TPA: hypothetical protein VFA66_07025 [Gaiellaceae bacterium]|nr:hypothetical protein [Gaiellaceae bacterium]
MARDRLTGLAVLLAALAAGCGGAGPEKAGGPAEPSVLTMANGYADLTFEPAVAYFVQRVAERSHGALRIRVVGDWGLVKNVEQAGFEQRIVGDVASGTADLAWVGTRVFDTLGANGFRALTAPMLVDRYGLERAVLRSPIPEQMLAGLRRLHVRGLAVLADSLRKPIAVRRALLRPADWSGLVFATVRSATQAGAVRALGARVSNLWGAPLGDAVAAGKVQAFEKSLPLYELTGQEEVAPYVTVNVNLWPQTIALIANPRRLGGRAAGWLREAAHDAVTRSLALADRDTVAAAELCRRGARFETASAADLVALRRAFVPVYRTLERDPQTRRFIAQIERLKRATPADPPLPLRRACSGVAPARGSVAGTPAAGDQHALDGVYRVAWTRADLLRAGTSPLFARETYGVTTMTLRGGRAAVRTVPSLGTPVCGADYRLDGRVLAFAFTSVCSGAFTASWSLRGNELRLRVLRGEDPGDPVFWGGKPWRRLG